jgi:hypothetical protein
LIYSLFSRLGIQTELLRKKINSKSFSSTFLEKSLPTSSFNNLFEKNSKTLNTQILEHVNFHYKQSLVYFLSNNLLYFDENKVLRQFSGQLFCKLLVFQLTSALIKSPFITLTDIQNKFLLTFLRYCKKNLNIKGIKIIFSGRWFNSLDGRTKKITLNLGNNNFRTNIYFCSYGSSSFFTKFGACNLKV